MRKVSLLCVGKLKERFYEDAVAEYQKRLSRFCKLEMVEFPEQRLSDSPSAAEIERALFTESTLIQQKLPNNATIVAMCIEGQCVSSEAFSKRLTRFYTEGSTELAFLIGGSFGLHPSAKKRAVWKLSLSPMTFPHHLARVILLEQIYRAFQIENGGKYHK